MRISKRVYLILAMLVFLFNSKDIFAYEAIDKDRDGWEPYAAGPITTWTAPLCGKNKLAIQPYFFYNYTRGVFDSDGHQDSLGENSKKYQYQEMLFFQYGLTDKLEIDGQFVYNQNYVRVEGDNANAAGFGDSYSFLRYCLVEENGWVPTVTLMNQIKYPTGKYQHAKEGDLGTDLNGAISGGGSFEQGYGFNLTKRLKPFVLHFDAIYNIPITTRVDSVKTEYGQYLNYDAGLEYFLPKGFNLMLELNGFLQGDRREDGTKIESSGVKYLNLGTGIGWSNSKIQTLISYQRVLTGTNTDANDSVVATFIYTF